MKRFRPLKGIQLGDLFLIIIMGVLLVQMTLNIFIFQNSAQQTYIDTVLRTTAAATFGYFLSNNFLKSCDPDFSDEVHEVRYSIRCKLVQVYIVGTLGIISLVLIILCRYCVDDTTEIRVIVSQLRDFVSSSVGFLIGSPVHAAPKNKR